MLFRSSMLRCYKAARTARNRSTDQPLSIPLAENSTIRPIFLLVLRLLGTSLHRGLLTATAPAAFQRLLALLGNPALPPLPSDLTLEALTARGLGDPVGTAPQGPVAMKVSYGTPRENDRTHRIPYRTTDPSRSNLQGRQACGPCPKCTLHQLIPRADRKSTRLNSSHSGESRMPSSA